MSELVIGASVPSALLELLMAEEITPGQSASYQLCKVIYSYHPLGAKMAEEPINIAQSQERIITIDDAPQSILIDAFKKEWEKLGCDGIIKNVMRQSRIYGVSSVAMGIKGIDTDKPLDLNEIQGKDLYFNVLDPLNTAGSLTLNQDPNAPDFQKPTYIMAAGNKYHSSRTIVVMNESPIYIEWTNSAFGYVGRSVYQRALFPLKTYVQTMLTDFHVTQKCGLLVAKLKSPGSIVDQKTRNFFGFKREAIKGGVTGNVLSIGIEEGLESLNFQNLKDAAEFARNNCLKNIATAANMPASMINMETLAEGFGEGTEDAKNIARFIDNIRIEMKPLYDFFDKVVMYRAWTPELFESLKSEGLATGSYETNFMAWRNAFHAEFPNLLIEPDSEKAKTQDIILKAAIGVFEVAAPNLDPKNKAITLQWLANVINNRDMLFSSPLEFDMDALKNYVPDEPIKEPTMEEVKSG